MCSGILRKSLSCKFFLQHTTTEQHRIILTHNFSFPFLPALIISDSVPYHTQSSILFAVPLHSITLPCICRSGQTVQSCTIAEAIVNMQFFAPHFRFITRNRIGFPSSSISKNHESIPIPNQSLTFRTIPFQHNFCVNSTFLYHFSFDSFY